MIVGCRLPSRPQAIFLEEQGRLPKVGIFGLDIKVGVEAGLNSPCSQLGKLRLREASGPLEVLQLDQCWDMNDQQTLGRQGRKGAPRRGYS